MLYSSSKEVALPVPEFGFQIEASFRLPGKSLVQVALTLTIAGFLQSTNCLPLPVNLMRHVLHWYTVEMQIEVL